MKNILSCFKIKKGRPQNVEVLKEKIEKCREKDIHDLRKATKKFKMLVDRGEIEVTIKNIKSVVKEVK
jgi:hypothetical protein